VNISHALIINEHRFWLSPERCIFWEAEKTLIVADLHAGKTGHFRKSGIPIPQTVFREDLQRLLTQILYFKAEQLIIIGDFAHSVQNKELDLFSRWRNDFSSLQIHLVKGNHDILDPDWYRQANMKIIDDELVLQLFSFRHDPEPPKPGQLRYHMFCGHLHPGVAIHGNGKQLLRFPCFYFTPGCCVLPAFSKFTGLSMVEPRKAENVYAIVNREIMQIQ
jgi:uncharacterized protein